VRSAREIIKAAARLTALAAAAPFVLSYAVRALVVGKDRALQSSTQLLSLVPGLTGQYIRRAFLSRTIARCHHTAVVEFGTTFSRAGAVVTQIVPGTVVAAGVPARIVRSRAGRPARVV
jgi:virginiamycin A acetyltransferase